MATTRLTLDLDIFRRRFTTIRAELDSIAAERDLDPAGIVIVSKYLERDDCYTLLDAGYSPLGENRAQEFEEKAEISDRDAWHFIGHMQRNKVALVLPRCAVFHSLDSERLARMASKWIEEHGVDSPRMLVQINVSGESSKSGLAPDRAPEQIQEWAERFPNLRLAGLMTMAPIVDDPEDCRPLFARLRELRDEVGERLDAPDEFRELSMGMSDDYRIAAEEGATLVRLGRTLYAE